MLAPHLTDLIKTACSDSLVLTGPTREGNKVDTAAVWSQLRTQHSENHHDKRVNFTAVTECFTAVTVQQQRANTKLKL